jgi:hypothetical protein
VRVAEARSLFRPELAEPGTTPAGRFRVTHLLRADNGEGAQAYIVESDSPRARVPTHFHLTEQFQVFLAGEGTFQRHAIQPNSVHYTDRYSTYGPIEAGDAGLTFAVLRQDFDPGGNYMPGSRDKLQGRPGRNLEVGTGMDPGLAHQVLVSEPDGLTVETHRLQCGERREVIGAGAPAGRYCMVVDGEAAIDGELSSAGLDRWSCVLVEAGDGPLTMRGLSETCQLLVMGFPVGEDSTASLASPGRSADA